MAAVRTAACKLELDFRQITWNEERRELVKHKLKSIFENNNNNTQFCVCA